MKPKYYQTSKGARKGQHGVEFEKNMSGLLLRRLLEANLQDFLLGREKTGVGKFDDICMVLEKTGTREIVLAQLKHKEDENLKICYNALAKHRSGDFFLPKYFESYPDIQKSLKEEEEFKGGNLKSLLICTNIGIEEQLKGIEKKQVYYNMIFKEDSAALFKLRITGKELKKEIFHQSYKSKLELLAEEMVHCFMHNKTIDIPSMVKDEVVSSLKTYHKPIADHVIDIATGKLKREFLNPTKDEIKKLRDCFDISLEDFYMKYRSLNMDELKSEFNIREREAQELEIRLWEYGSRVSSETFLENHYFKKPNFGKSLDKVIFQHSLPPEENIDENEIGSEIDEFLERLIFVTDLRYIKSTIKLNISLEVYTNLKEKLDEWYDDVSIKNGELHRKWLWKKEISQKAMESFIHFQGKRVNLGQLLAGNENILTPDLLMHVFGRQNIQDLNISVGRSPEQSKIINYYISRKICRPSKDEGEEVFTEKDLVQRDLSQASRIWLIVGEPGMGKTTFLQNIATEFVQNVDGDKRPTWIIFVPLITCKNLIKDLNPKNVEDVIRFFAHQVNCKDEFWKTLLKDFIMEEGEMKVFLDGLDELSENEQKKIIDLVQVSLKKTRINQIWLTARTHLKQDLEATFKEISFTLDKLKAYDQISLLVKYWKYASPHLEETKLNNFAHNLIEKINLHIDTKWQAFLGIPLQAYMIGFIFQGEIDKENPETPDSITLASLYDRFVEEKYQVYFRKVGLSEQEESIKKDLRSKWNKYYEQLALLYGRITERQLSVDQVKSWFSIDVNRNNVDSILKIGIVYEREDKIFFIHQTFAEYFVAKLFADICKSKHICQQPKECFDVMNKVLFPDLYELYSNSFIFKYQLNFNNIISVLFDLKISENSPLHSSVLIGDKEKVETFSEEEINTKDCLGRTALYYALCYEQRSILEILFRKKIYVDLNDTYFILYWVLPVEKCLDVFYFGFLTWSASIFLRLATQVDIALYILKNRNALIVSDRHSFRPFEEIKFYPTSRSLPLAAQKQLSNAKIILQELTVDFGEVIPDNLAKKICELRYQKIPLIEAHYYFRKNAEFILNADEADLRKFCDSSDFRTHTDVLRLSKKTAEKVIEHLIQLQVPFKKYFPIIAEVRKRCKNLFAIFKKFIFLQIPTHKIYDQTYPFPHKSFSDFFCFSINSQYKNHLLKLSADTTHCSFLNLNEELGKLKKNVDEGDITGLWAEIVNEVWSAGQDYKIKNFGNYCLQDAVSEAITYAVSSTKISQLLLLYDSLKNAVFSLNKSRVFSILKEADERGLLELVLNIIRKDGNTLENLVQRAISIYSEHPSKQLLAQEILNLLTRCREKGLKVNNKRKGRKKRRGRRH